MAGDGGHSARCAGGDPSTCGDGAQPQQFTGGHPGPRSPQRGRAAVHRAHLGQSGDLHSQGTAEHQVGRYVCVVDSQTVLHESLQNGMLRGKYVHLFHVVFFFCFSIATFHRVQSEGRMFSCCELHHCLTVILAQNLDCLQLQGRCCDTVCNCHGILYCACLLYKTAHFAHCFVTQVT